MLECFVNLHTYSDALPSHKNMKIDLCVRVCLSVDLFNNFVYYRQNIIGVHLVCSTFIVCNIIIIVHVSCCYITLSTPFFRKCKYKYHVFVNNSTKKKQETKK